MSDEGKSYILEMYEPNSSERDVLVMYETNFPLPAIAAGDILRPLFDGEQPAGQVLKVRHVEHMVWNFEGHPRFKMCVYTEPVSDHPHDW